MRRTRFVLSSITSVALVAGLGTASEKPFQAGAADSYAHQSSDQVTVGAKPFNNDEQVEEVFGKKAELLKYGVLPVLIVIENKRTQAVDLHDLEVSLVAADGRHAQAVDPEQIPSLASHTKRPAIKPYPPLPLPKKKSPLSSSEIASRAFPAKMLPPGESASGFFYFEARPESGDQLYLNGIRDARTQKDIMYFEFPLDK